MGLGKMGGHVTPKIEGSQPPTQNFNRYYLRNE